MQSRSVWILAATTVVAVSVITGTAAQRGAPATQAPTARVAIDPDDIGGVVTSTKGPEAGVWVIAETDDLKTKYRKIVVTDDQGRYLLPDLPKANYRIWVRGYGLVDSRPVQSGPGRTVALTATLAPTPQAAAHIYPANYWYSLMQVPPPSAFPMTFTATGGGRNGGQPQQRTIQNQAEFVGALKCNACHQVGGINTRKLSTYGENFKSSAEAWIRAKRSGQTGSPTMFEAFGGQEKGAAMFGDWSDRIAAGEVPQAPPRPQGVERNVVITLWDYSVPVAFIHDITVTNKRNPTVNAYGPVFGAEWSQGTLVTIDPKSNAAGSIYVPVKNEADRAKMRTWSRQQIDMPSPTWGEEIIWTDPVNPHTPMMDSKGRPWVNVQVGLDNPQWCKTDTTNPFVKAAPQTSSDGWGVSYYDAKAGKVIPVDLCFRSHHTVMADNDMLFFNINGQGQNGVGWLDIKKFDATGDAKQSQGWCRAILDYNGDGKIGPYTMPNEAPNPTMDRMSSGSGYGVSTSPVDGSIWYVVTGPIPGKLVRVSRGSNPPETCVAEEFEPPYNNPAVPGMMAMTPRGVDVDSKGVVWTALSGSNHLASFDRSKCKASLNGPKATGQHCPEGWTLLTAPGPKFKGVVGDLGTDYFYYNWTDVFDTSGLGKDTQFVTGTWSDSLMAVKAGTTDWITLRVPYPLGFYARGLEGRIDDPKAGWKGRGIWSSNEVRGSWLTEGGKGTLSQVAQFQIRPNPLAK